MLIGLIKLETPKTNNIFVILLPIKLPIKISSKCLLAADIVTNNSGNEVPTAIKLNPIISVPILAAIARFLAAGIKNFEPKYNPTMPINVIPKFFMKFLSICLFLLIF